MLATISSAVVDGIDGLSITIEVINTGTGTPRFTVVGLPDTTIRESRDRVRAALMSSGYKWPSTLPLTVNLAPSDVRKHGAGLDLPLALGVLVASKQLDQSEVAGVAAVGELGLDGSIRRVPGLVSLAEALSRASVSDRSELVVPLDGASEAAIVAPGRVRGASCLRDLVEGLKGEGPLPGLVEARAVLEHELLNGALTARGFARVWRVARTIADLDGAPPCVEKQHVRAALLLRVRVGALLGATP